MNAVHWNCLTLNCIVFCFLLSCLHSTHTHTHSKHNRNNDQRKKKKPRRKYEKVVFTFHINFDPIFSIALSNNICEMRQKKKKRIATLLYTCMPCTHTPEHWCKALSNHIFFAPILLDLLSYSTENLYIFFSSFIELNSFTMQNGLNSCCKVPSHSYVRYKIDNNDDDDAFAHI